MKEMSEITSSGLKEETKADNQKLAKFKKPFHARDEENVWLLVSLENEKQSSEMLASFFELMERLKRNKIKVIVSDVLNRYYKGQEKSKAMGEAWFATNKEILEKYKHKIDIEIVWWEDLIQSDVVQEKQNDLKDLYQKNEEYRTVVDGITTRHAKKASVEAARDYIFEECIVISSLQGHLCYPADELNEALKISVNHFNTSLIYHGYAIYDKNKMREYKKQRKVSVNPTNAENILNDDDNAVSFYFGKFMESLERHGIFGVEKQTMFFKQLVESKNKVSSKALVETDFVNTKPLNDERGESKKNNFCTENIQIVL